jgi:hypothetical protein
MPRKSGSINKSEEVRKLLKANPKTTVREIVEALAGRGIKISTNQVYFVKGKMHGRRGRRKKARQMVARVAATGNADPISTVKKVKALADELGGLRKLKELVDVLTA